VTDERYKRLVTLAAREHELVVQEDFEALERLWADRDALIATLPAAAPASARPALIEAARIQASTTTELQRARARVAAELSSLDRGRDTARGYERASGSAPRVGTITVAA
jgi:hypothetical protein